MLAVSVQNSLAATLVDEGKSFLEGDAWAPLAIEVSLSEGRT